MRSLIASPQPPIYFAPIHVVQKRFLTGPAFAPRFLTSPENYEKQPDSPREMGRAGGLGSLCSLTLAVLARACFVSGVTD